MDLASILGPTAESMLVSGKMVVSMAKVSTYQILVRSQEKENGFKANA